MSAAAVLMVAIAGTVLSPARAQQDPSAHHFAVFLHRSAKRLAGVGYGADLCHRSFRPRDVTAQSQRQRFVGSEGRAP